MKTVMIGDRRFRLPFIDLVPFDDAQNAELGAAIEQDGKVKVRVVCWKEKKTSSEDTVIDGAHRCVWAAAHKLDGVPVEYRSFDSEDEAKAECERLNLARRHLTPEQQSEIKSRRVAREAERRRQGQSFRTIAEAEGVSVGQVQRDLAEAGVSGGYTCPPNGQVTGQDGKKYAAKPVLCKRCRRLGRPVKDCSACEAERKKATKKKAAAKRQKADAAAKLDCFKNPVPANRCDALFDPWIQKAIDFLAVTSEAFRQERLMDQMAKKGKHYPFINAKDFVDGCSFVCDYFDRLILHLKNFRPEAVCKSCRGSGCGSCRMAGLVPRHVYLGEAPTDRL